MSSKPSRLKSATTCEVQPPLRPKSVQSVVLNVVPLERQTHHWPQDGWKLAMSSKPSRLKSPTTCAVQPLLVPKSAQRVVTKPPPGCAILTIQLPFDG